MIVDTINNADKYKGLNPDVDRVLEAAKAYNKDNYPEAPIIVNENAKLINAAYTTGPASEAKFEAHRKCIDVMVMVDGEETIYVKPTTRLKKITQPYDDANDALLAEAEEDVTAVQMEPGMFCILFPQDAHLPGRIRGIAMPVKKFIGKVKIREEQEEQK